jgi:hypothetical protein
MKTLAKEQYKKGESDKELFNKAFGLNVGKMTKEQKDILREVVRPARLSWLSYVWGVSFLLAVYFLIRFDFITVGFYVLFGIATMLFDFHFHRWAAFRRYKKTVTNSEYISFKAENSLMFYFSVKYANSVRTLFVIIGIIYLFFNWRVGLSIILFATNILTPLKLYLQGRIGIRWSMFIFFFVTMIIIWIIFPR